MRWNRCSHIQSNQGKKAEKEIKICVGRWKTGYHKIATAVGCPVYLGYFDWGTKRIGRGQKFELTDDPVADTKRIQEIYEAMHLQGKHRENYATHL